MTARISGPGPGCWGLSRTRQRATITGRCAQALLSHPPAIGVCVRRGKGGKKSGAGLWYNAPRMLLGLTIRDVVLIDRLSLAFRPGLCVLTGETGAGKSILLDALGLALGRRADAGLVRPGAEQAAVAAEFVVEPNHPAAAILREAGSRRGRPRRHDPVAPRRRRRREEPRLCQ